MNREVCSERIRLADEYCRLVTEFNALLESLKAPTQSRNEDAWAAAEAARIASQGAWEALEKHIIEHRCVNLHWTEPTSTSSDQILAMAALAALDVIIVVNDDRRYVDVNDAGAAALGLPRSEIIGRRIDEFFSAPNGEPLPQAWAGFIADGVQSGICEMKGAGGRRKYEYRARANFAPGLHLSVLRELKEVE